MKINYQTIIKESNIVGERPPETIDHLSPYYYDDELNFREIGAVLSVSEARVCQLHAKAMLTLRRSLQSWVDENPAELAVLREDDA